MALDPTHVQREALAFAPTHVQREALAIAAATGSVASAIDRWKATMTRDIPTAVSAAAPFAVFTHVARK